MADFAAPLDLPELVLGGGLGVAYVESEEAPTITQWGNVVLDACDALGVRSTVSVEPGRSIVAAAAMTVYTVGTIKQIPGVRTYVAVDGGMSDNPRPGALRDRATRRSCRVRSTPNARCTARLVGKHCESRRRAAVRRPRSPPTSPSATCSPCRSPVPTATRWGRTTTRSPVRRWCSCADGAARLVVRRETFDDLLATDVG